MGAMPEYSRWLIPRGNEFKPSASAVAGLVQRLRKDRWIVDLPGLPKCRFEGAREKFAAATGGLAVRTVDNTFGQDARAKLVASTEPQPQDLTADWLEAPQRDELRLVWPVDIEEGTLQFPLSLGPPKGEPGERIRYDLEVQLSSDYVYPVARNIGPIPTDCSCGEDLAFEWDEDELVPAFTESSGIFATCEACCRTFEPGAGSATLTRPFDGLSSEVRGGAAYRFALKWKSRQYAAEPLLAFHRDLVALVEDEFGRGFFEVGSLS
jgi:hypothetical protein